MDQKTAVPWLLKWIGVVAFAWWTRLDVPVRALLMFMGVDYLTGLAAALVRRELSSAIGLKGLVKKTATLLLIYAIYIAQRDLGFGNEQFSAGHVIAGGYALNELISILENCARVGVPIPGTVIGWLLSVKSLRPKAATTEQLARLSAEKE